jgi:hypothetical protein
MRFIAQILLRRVYSNEETEELQGISDVTGLPMFLLVAFNVLLDLLLGCTSGGVRVGSGLEGLDDGESRMIHFRTLDWGMDPLRNLTAEIDFVRSEGGPVVASVVTYFGYVGVLTGVRSGLSMSLNFRGRHDTSTRKKAISFRWHQAMVILGFRQSISSVLRQVLLDDSSLIGTGEGATNGEHFCESRVASIVASLLPSPSTAAYLIFCTPQRVRVIEKDNHSGTIHESDTFLSAYNHDRADEDDATQIESLVEHVASSNVQSGMVAIVAYSLERKDHLERMWRRRVTACRRRLGFRGEEVAMADVMKLVKDLEISNDQTHYAAVMDPEMGQVIWRRAYEAYEVYYL